MTTQKFELDVESTDLLLAAQETEDVRTHLSGVLKMWATCAREKALAKPEHLGKTDEQLIADIPSIKQREVNRIAQELEQQQSQSEHQSAMQLLIDAVPKDVRNAVSSAVSERLNRERDMSADARSKLIADAVSKAQAERDRESDQMAAALKRAASRLSASDLAELGLTRAK